MTELYPFTEVKIRQLEFLCGKNNNLRFQSYNWMTCGTVGNSQKFKEDLYANKYLTEKSRPFMLSHLL